MNRRTVLATAGAITLVIVTGVAAAAANLGLLDSATDPGVVGTLTPASATAEPQTVVVEPAPPPPTDGTAVPAGSDAATARDDDRRTHEYGEDSSDDHGRSEAHESSEQSHEDYEGYHDDD
jgi:hypothetical protein